MSAARCSTQLGMANGRIEGNVLLISPSSTDAWEKRLNSILRQTHSFQFNYTQIYRIMLGALGVFVTLKTQSVCSRKNLQADLL